MLVQKVIILIHVGQDILEALKDPLAMTKRWKRMPFWNWNPRFKVTEMFDGLMLNGIATKASFKMYLILKLQTTLPCLEFWMDEYYLDSN